MTAEAVRQFVLQLQQCRELSEMRLHRTYYYDAYPSAEVVKKPLNGGVLDFGKSNAYARNRKLFSELAVQPFMALRMGEVVQNGWKVSHKLLNSPTDKVELTSEHIQPAIGQKGVDMRIGLDIASLTLKHQVQVIVLVTGDSDFVPAMKFARKEGTQLYLVTLGHGVKDTMLEHADLLIQL